MSFDEEQRNEHDECRAEIHRLEAEVERLDKLVFAYESVGAPVNPLQAEIERLQADNILLTHSLAACTKPTIAELTAQLDAEAEIKRLRTLIDQTADGALVPDCEELYCSKCAQPVRETYDLCYCDHCHNPDSGSPYPSTPLPLSYGECYSTEAAVEATRNEK